MSTRHVILGLLSERPSHSYEVAVRFGERLKLWDVNRGQVYNTVARLAKDGFIEEADEHGGNPKSGPSWRLTERGQIEFERWLATLPDGIEPLRGNLLAKLAVAEPQHARELLVSLDNYERDLLIAIEADIRDRRELTSGEDIGKWERDVAECIADAAIMHRDADLEWIRRAREVVSEWAGREGAAHRATAPRAKAPARRERSTTRNNIARAR